MQGSVDMITPKAIDKLISITLATAFPDVEVVSTDVEEGFTRPSFKVVLSDMRFNEWQNYTENYMSVRVYYFPSDQHEYSLEILEKQHELRQLFNYTLSIDDTTILIHEATTDITDKVMYYDFDISYLDESNREQPVYEDMEELITDVEAI